MPLPKYFIPRELKRAVVAIESSTPVDSSSLTSVRKNFDRVLKELRSVDCLEIAECHYHQLLKLALYLEELQERRDTNKFEMHRTKIELVEEGKRKFKIYIKGVEEDNSPLNFSDTLRVYEESDPNVVFFLRVSKVCSGYIVVTADGRFCKKYSSEEEYSIVLIFDTYTYQCCHYALKTLDLYQISPFFFPKRTDPYSQKPNSFQTWFNKDVFHNPEQRQAVFNIVNKSAHPAPYVLYGPPGTGKTSTLVEAVCQIMKLPCRYILICAPSNAACDVITIKLLEHTSADRIYRIYSQSHDYDSIDENIRECCNYKGEGMVDDLEKKDLSGITVIISTIVTSLRLEKLELFYSHVFIDEASQATVPQALLPICAAKSSLDFQLVISGDHQQLGPGIRSVLAKPLIGQSLLEQLMKHEPYKKDEKTGYDPRYITKLIRNYRSKKEIIHVSDVLFYDNELIACSKTNSNSFPVTFYAVNGKEQKTTKSKSSYNQAEINEVLQQVRRFNGKQKGGKFIRETDIGIVTPFRLQAAEIRRKLNYMGLKGVEVGTVETYQGQEKEVIIVSTVRSKTFTHNGIEHIGFLSNSKRFNVALTRAKNFLVVVGNPRVLETDKNWRYFLKFCQENNACRGDSFVMKDELYYSMRDLSIGSRCKNSIDLFEKTLEILTIDDGCIVDNKRFKIKSSSKSSTSNNSSTSTVTVSPSIHSYLSIKSNITLDIDSQNTSKRSSADINIVTSITNSPSCSYNYSNNLSHCYSPEISRANSISDKIPLVTSDYSNVNYNYNPRTASERKKPCNIL